MHLIVQKIFNHLYLPNIKDAEIGLSKFRLLKTIKDLELTSQNKVIQSFIDYLNDLEPIFPKHIELFCLSKLSSIILEQYPVNIIEAYLLSHLFLNQKENISTIYFKLGMSGLLAPTIINNEKIEDFEAIAQFVIQSLKNADLISLQNEEISLGKSFNLNA